LPAGDSELVQKVTKGPYNLELLDLGAEVEERRLEEAWSPTSSASCSNWAVPPDRAGLRGGE
jgi:hypothetical protein